MSDRSLLVGFVDYVGRLRVRLLPPAERERAYSSGVTYNRANLNLDLAETLPPDPVLPSITGEFAVVGDRDSQRPFPSSAPFDICFGRLTDVVGTPWPEACTRTALVAAVARLDALGLHALVGFEPEGYLLAGDGSPLGHQHFSSSTSLVALAPFLTAVVQRCAESNVRLEQCSKELGPNQFEVNLPPRPPLAAADDLVVVQEACRNVAREMGLHATFMPRVSTELPTSGSHVHLSLHTATGNALGAHPTELTAVGRSAIAGLLGRAGPISMLALPTVNSYKRLRPGTWVPVLAAWSRTSRDALVRVVGDGDALRVEYRGADGCANPYLMLAAMLHAIADGVQAQAVLDDDLHLDDDIGEPDHRAWALDGRPVLPGTLGDAIASFVADPSLRDALGTVTSDVMVQVKRREWRSFVDTVTDWDRQLYLSLF